MESHLIWLLGKGNGQCFIFTPRRELQVARNKLVPFATILKRSEPSAEVYGISADTVAEQAAFHKEHRLTFTLLADPEDKIIEMYGTKMPMVKMSKRWTFVVDPELKIRSIAKDVDPVMDAERVAKEIADLKKK